MRTTDITLDTAHLYLLCSSRSSAKTGTASDCRCQPGLLPYRDEPRREGSLIYLSHLVSCFSSNKWEALSCCFFGNSWRPVFWTSYRTPGLSSCLETDWEGVPPTPTPTKANNGFATTVALVQQTGIEFLSPQSSL